MRLANSGGCLFAALLAFLFVATAAASEDLSGRWKISYVVQSGGPDEKFAEGSVVSLSEKDSTLQGKATLGSRGDGFLIGSRQGSDVQAAITFRSNPALFLRLSCSFGCRAAKAMMGCRAASPPPAGEASGKGSSLPPK